MHLDKLELLVRLLPTRTQSPISLQSLAEDIEVNRETVKSWLRLLEILYLGFYVRPFTKKINRAVKKEAKWYFFQWTFNEEPSAIFENYVAVQLLTICQLWRDAGLGIFELFYLRDQDRREVDFVVTKNLVPIMLIECKLQAQEWPASLNFYAEKLQIPSFLVSKSGPIRRINSRKWIIPYHIFLDFLF